METETKKKKGRGRPRTEPTVVERIPVSILAMVRELKATHKNGTPPANGMR